MTIQTRRDEYFPPDVCKDLILLEAEVSTRVFGGTDSMFPMSQSSAKLVEVQYKTTIVSYVLFTDRFQYEICIIRSLQTVIVGPYKFRRAGPVQIREEQ